MNSQEVFIESLGIGLNSYNNMFNLDLQSSEYLVVGQRANDNPTDLKDIKYNFMVTNNGIGINATRNQMSSGGKGGLYTSSDIICDGKIIANGGIEIADIGFGPDINQTSLYQLLTISSSNNIFYQGSNLIKNSDNKYTTSFLTLGDKYATYSNIHPLNIVNSGNNTIQNNHISIQNDINNDNNDINEPSRLTFGIIGNNQESPATITTTMNMPLEFHISKDSSEINKLYSDNSGVPNYNYAPSPAMVIFPNNSVGINTSIVDNLTYNLLYPKEYISLTKKPSLHVNGLAYINTICTYDYNTGSIKSLDDIYMRKIGLTLNANQIMPGQFSDGTYTFISDVNIGDKNTIKKASLTIYNYVNIIGNLDVNGGQTSLNDLTVMGITNFNNIVHFNDEVKFENVGLSNLTINGNLFLDSLRINSHLVQGQDSVQTIMSYSNDSFNISGTSNIAIGGRLGVGIRRTDFYINQFTINKHDSTNFQILIQDIQTNSTDTSKVYMGHTSQKSIYDNSFVFLTQKTIKDHNFYFYPGVNYNNNIYPKLVPTFAIMQNNRVGINTNMPQKTLDVIGDVLANNYYTRDISNNIILTKPLINKNNDIMIPDIKSLNVNISDISIYNNSKTLNVLNGINSYDGYYINKSKICPILYNSSSTIGFLNEKLGIGASDNITAPLQIRNNNLTLNNNSVLRFYRGKVSGNSQALYSGIDICDYNSPSPEFDKNNFKWFIYKCHIDNYIDGLIGPLQIGYTYNTYNPTKTAINIYYDPVSLYHLDINKPSIDYNYNKSSAMSIYGDLEVYGNINIIGNKNYKLNGINVGDFTHLVSQQSSQNNNQINNDIANNDISMIGSKIIMLSDKTTIVGFKDDWILNHIPITNAESIPLYIYQNKYNTPALKIYTTNFNNINQPNISKIEIGLINNTSITPSQILTNNVELILKGYPQSDNTNIFEIRNSSLSFISFISKSSTRTYAHIGASQNSYDGTDGSLYSYNKDATLHVDDNSKYLLQLTNETLAPAINFHKKTNNNNYNWILKGPNEDDDNSFNINYESTSQFNNEIITSNNKILQITNDGYYFMNSNFSPNLIKNNTMNVNSVYNKSSILLTNNYNSNQLFNNQSNIIFDNSNLIYSTEVLFDAKNKIINSYFNYHIHSSNLGTNYYINNSNINFKNNIRKTTEHNISNILVNYIYTDFNTRATSATVTNNIIQKEFNLLPIIRSQNPNYTYIIDDNSKQIFEEIIPNDTNWTYKNRYTCPNDPYVSVVTSNHLIPFTPNSSSNIYFNIINTSYYTFYQAENVFLRDKVRFFDFDIIKIGSIDNIIYTYNTIEYNKYEDFNILLTKVEIDNDININNYIEVPKSLIKTNSTNTFTSGNTNNLISIETHSSLLNNSYGIVNEDVLLFTNNYVNNIELDINDSNEKIIVSNTIELKSYYSTYNFTDPNNIYNILIPIYYNNYVPHITLANFIDNTNYQVNNIHKIYSYDGNLEFHLDNSKLFSINNIGNSEFKGDISANNVILKGDIFDKYGNAVYPNLNSPIYTINSSDAYLVNSSNAIFNTQGFKITRDNSELISKNLFEIKGGLNGDANFITLNSQSYGSFINFTSIYNNAKYLFRTGVSENTFGIWTYKNSTFDDYVDGKFDSKDDYSQAFGISLNTINNNFDYYFDGNIKISKPFKFITDTKDIIKINNDTGDVEFYNNIIAYKDIKTEGNLLTTSDKRIKYDITKIDNALNKLLTLNGITYKNLLTDEMNSGLIAQEVQEILPEVVKKDEKEYLTIAYGNMMGLVIEAIKELKKEVDEIKARIN